VRTPAGVVPEQKRKRADTSPVDEVEHPGALVEKRDG
jgi:hypothetical protein